MSLALTGHPGHPPAAVRTLKARVSMADGGWLQLRWLVDGSKRLVIPLFAGRGRTDGLWRTTCFELFCRRLGGEGYSELNFSPSEHWAAYDFTGYREGMADRPLRRDPVITPRRGRDLLIVDAALRLEDLPPLPWSFGLSAVLEEEGGAISYWSLAHPPHKPDFHHPACFAARLEPPAG